MAGKLQTFAAMTPRQKMMAGIFVVIVLVLLWQAYKLFGETRTQTATVAKKATPTQSATQAAPPVSTAPQPAQLIKSPATIQHELTLERLQQQTQAKYLTAISELQMLKVARDIAETNQKIMSARLAAVTAQKRIVDLLSPPPPVTEQAYSSTLLAPPSAAQKAVAADRFGEEVKYVVISVAQLQYRWSAVIGSKGVLYNVHVGDVLPPDNSKVIAIDRSGVVLQKNGVRKRISLVPII